MENDISKKLVDKYLKGECSPEENATIHEWYDSFENGSDMENIIPFDQREELRRRLLSRIKSRIISAEGNSIERKFNISKALIYISSGIAAMLVLAVGLSLLSRKATVPENFKNIRIVNMTKTIQRIVLSDSSIVWLNPKSSLNYPEKFSLEERKVQMQGEAFFEISTDSMRPFLIYSDNVITRVLGTSFRIRAYESVPVEVSVLTGKVSVKLIEKSASELILLPNQKATYQKSTDLLEKDTELKASAMSIWQKETMTFDNQTIKEVIEVLNRQFNVNISVEDEKLLSYVLKADFNDQSLPSILEMLQKSLGVEYELNDRQIKLYMSYN